MLPVGLPHHDTVPLSSRITIKSMQLLFKRLNSERLVETLEEQSVWDLLESDSTFLQGVGLLARWAPRLPQGGQGDLQRHLLAGKSRWELNASLLGGLPG